MKFIEKRLFESRKEQAMGTESIEGETLHQMYTDCINRKFVPFQTDIYKFRFAMLDNTIIEWLKD